MSNIFPGAQGPNMAPRHGVDPVDLTFQANVPITRVGPESAGEPSGEPGSGFTRQKPSPTSASHSQPSSGAPEPTGEASPPQIPTVEAPAGPGNSDIKPAPVVAQDRPQQPELQISSPEELATHVRRLGDSVADESVLTASGAMYAALGNDMRKPRDVDLAVSPEAYAYLRSQPGWEVKGDRITKGPYDIGPSWEGTPYADLTQRSWTTKEGIKVVSLSDVVSEKTWGRNNEKDRADLDAIRDRLLDPTRPPLPDNVKATEIDIARSCLPEGLRDHPDADVSVKTAANGLAVVRALYGDPRIGRPNQIVGSLERPEHQVPATYHNGFDLEKDVRTLQGHMSNIGATPAQHFAALEAESYSDIAYGGGRRSDNPTGYDELRSAELLAAHATMAGLPPEAVKERYDAVIGTGFDEKTGTQMGRHHPNPVVRGVAGVDLQVLSEPDAVPAAHDLAVEDGHSARASDARTLGKVAAEHGVRISSTLDGLRFIDQHPDAKPADAPDGPTVLEAHARRIGGSAGFHHPERGYRPPDGWTMEDKPMRTLNSAELGRESAALLNGTLTAEAAYEEAKKHRQRHS